MCIASQKNLENMQQKLITSSIKMFHGDAVEVAYKKNKIEREIIMFTFVIKTKNVDGVVTTMEFHTASCFLAACEDNAATFLHDLIVSVYYGGATVNTSQFNNVYDLYRLMCSDVCDWF